MQNNSKDSRTLNVNRSIDSIINLPADETPHESYERLKIEIGNKIDVDGVDELSAAIHELDESTSSEIIINAFLAACIRRRVTIQNKDFDAQVVMLPVIIRNSDMHAMPSEIDAETSKIMQKYLMDELKAEGKKDSIIIPVNKLYTCIEFSNEQPEQMHKMLTAVTEGIKNNKPGYYQNFIVIPDDEIFEDDEMFMDQGSYITFKLLPLILLSPVGDEFPKSLSNQILLNKLAGLIALCGQDNAQSNSNASNQVGTQVSAMAIATPSTAEYSVRMSLVRQRLISEAGLALERSEDGFSEANLVYNGSEKVLKIDIKVHSGNNVALEVNLMLSMSNSYLTHKNMEILADDLRIIGYKHVTTSSLDEMPNMDVPTRMSH
jgi:hypothetical protein